MMLGFIPPRNARRIVSAARLNAAVAAGGRRVEYVRKINGQMVEVIRNPTPRDTAQMTREAIATYPNTRKAKLDEHIRFTQDPAGNHYAWKAYEATHSDIEAAIARVFGFKMETTR